MNNRKNLISMIILQFISLIYGLIIPRLIIHTFGSNVNGLITSITQFLSFISLLEGGLGAVVLAELYKPIEEQNNIVIKKILQASQNFFIILSSVFIIYSLLLAIIYPVFISKEYTISYVAPLVLILSLTTFIQYLFSITYKLFLQAEQRLYIVNYVTAITLSLNVIVTVILIKIYPEIHVLKLASALIFVLQPLIYHYYVNEKYRISLFRFSMKSSKVLRNCWSGFFQNLAHFINMNTDIMLITIFVSLTEVSIYSVYMIAIAALRTIITSLDNSYQGALGKLIAQGDNNRLSENFEIFESINWVGSIILYNCCLLLINPFVQLYTHNITDIIYYEPLFAYIMIIANMIYCIREPYRLVILAAGKFRETNFGSTVEAILNLLISIILVQRYSLIGVAIGTLIAMTFRFLYFIYYLRKDILHRSYRKYLGNILFFSFSIVINTFIYFNISISMNSIMSFLLYGMVIMIAETILVLILYLMFNYRSALRLYSFIIKKQNIGR